MFTQKYADRIRGVLSCLDRVILTGTIPDTCHARAMARQRQLSGVRTADYTTQFAQPLRDEIRQNATRVADVSGSTART